MTCSTAFPRLVHLLLAAALCVAPACATAHDTPLVALEIVDRDTGQVLPAWHARGQTWIEGTPGHRYAVRLRNATGERMLVVLSVDGVNAVTGETADPAQAGYVLAPWQAADIGGWRKSMAEVAQFVFTDLPAAYAARTGRPDNIGVIGIAVFRDARALAWRAPASPDADVTREASAAPAGARSAAADAAPQRLGTGHGAREWSPVGHAGFERASVRPAQVTELRYDDADALLALGVLQRRAAHPRAFPGGFVPDPPR